MSSQDADSPKTPTWQLVAVWALVLVPMGWGVVETLAKAAQLFS